MSEYWKSTPKYWCKHCKTYVRDTKLEKQNHDATPKHQGNLKRFLRDLHRNNEKDQKDKDRAKQEVARLNGIVSGTGSGSSSGSGFGRGPTPSLPKQVQATAEQRKRQLAELAELGVSVPDDFRGGLAMAGEWQVTSERIIDPEHDKEKRPEALGIGVRKRPVKAEDEDAEAEAVDRKRTRWGAVYRTHPGDDDADLDALLNNTAGRLGSRSGVKHDEAEGLYVRPDPGIDGVKEEDSTPNLKSEPSFGEVKLSEAPHAAADMEVKADPDPTTGPDPDPSLDTVLFKKRKAKCIRQK
jgi:hypothetical protein